MEVNDQQNALTPLHTRKKLRCPSNRRLGGSQSQSGRFGTEENLLSLLGFGPHIVLLQPKLSTDCATLVPQLSVWTFLINFTHISKRAGEKRNLWLSCHMFSMWHNALCTSHMKHNGFIPRGMSVSRAGWALKLLWTQ